MHACKQKQTQTHPTLHLILKALKIFLTRWCRSLIGRQEEAGDFCETEVRLLYMVCSRTGKGYTDCLSPAPPKKFLACKSTLFWLKQHLRQAPESPQRCRWSHTLSRHPFRFVSPAVSAGAPRPFLCSCSTGEQDVFHICSRGLKPNPHQRDS